MAILRLVWPVTFVVTGVLPNFASFFFYDAEGNLHLTKKETREGIKTINENVSYQIEH